MTTQSPLRAYLKLDGYDCAHLLALFSSCCLYFGTGKRQKKKMDAVSLAFSFFFSLSTGKHWVLCPSPANKSLFFFPFCCSFLPSCLLDQSFHSCDKQTDEWMDVTSFQLLIYKQTRRLFFKRKLYGTF